MQNGKNFNNKLHIKRGRNKAIEYMNLGKSILYAIRNMINNQLF